MAQLKSLYDTDFVAWSKQQAEALRAAMRGGSNQQLDWENLAEEIESLGVSQRSALASYIIRIIQHLVKLEYSPAIDPRHGWRHTIRLARVQADRRLKANPSLRPELAQLVENETATGIELAIADLEQHAEIDELDALVLRRRRYTEDEVLGGWLPPEPPRGAE